MRGSNPHRHAGPVLMEAHKTAERAFAQRKRDSDKYAKFSPDPYLDNAGPAL